jgi:pyrimidine operon attenuation protein/uracil phosphoribosyltransferase
VRTVLQKLDIAKALTRLSHEIIEAHQSVGELVILGIPTRGAVLANRIAATIDQIVSVGTSKVPTTEVGSLDVTMYRDDLSRNLTRTPARTTLPSTVDGKTVVLIDDVLSTGRTIRAALDALSDYGRPRVVRLAVLVDRGHRELPIRADYVGKNLPTSINERISVHLAETDGDERVTIDIERGTA